MSLLNSLYYLLCVVILLFSGQQNERAYHARVHPLIFSQKSSILETKLIYKRLTLKSISKRFKYHITYHVKAWIFELNLQIVFK